LENGLKNRAKACSMVARAKYLPPYSTIGPEEISCGADVMSKGLIPSIAGKMRK
ncbi:unnamed protein product, partial [marine sediment metagenome]